MNGKKSNAPSPIILDVECDRHRARLTSAACSLLGIYREDCQGCERADHVADPDKMGKRNTWAVKYAGYIQSRAKHKQKKVEAKVELYEKQIQSLFRRKLAGKLASKK